MQKALLRKPSGFALLCFAQLHNGQTAQKCSCRQALLHAENYMQKGLFRKPSGFAPLCFAQLRNGRTAQKCPCEQAFLLAVKYAQEAMPPQVLPTPLSCASARLCKDDFAGKSVKVNLKHTRDAPLRDPSRPMPSMLCTAGEPIGSRRLFRRCTG